MKASMGERPLYSELWEWKHNLNDRFGTSPAMSIHIFHLALLDLCFPPAWKPKHTSGMRALFLNLASPNECPRYQTTNRKAQVC